MKTWLSLIVASAVSGFAPAVASAQVTAPASAGWEAWYGCWQPAGEGITQDQSLCILPGDDSMSARFLTIESGAVAGETMIRADAVARPVEEGGCAGTQSAHFSADGRRVFTRSDLTCSAAARVSTGILGFVAGDRWVDSQGLTVRDQHAARTIVYQAISMNGMPTEVVEALPGDRRLAREAARLDVSAPMGTTAVIEAAGEVAPPALEGFLAEAGQGARLAAADLIMLEEHGVSPSTIDVMVALAYPERFVVRENEAEAEDAMLLRPSATRTVFMRDYCYDPFWSGRFADCYNGYGYSNMYGRFGYSPWGYDPYGWRYSRSPVFVVVEPGQEESGGGRVVRGRGYTPSDGGSSRPATRRDGSSSESLSPSSRPRGSAGASGGSRGPSSSGGYAPSGDSGSTPTRTAKPRGSE